jgi:hypothetical protein
MRINYTDEETFPGQFDLWHANCMRSIKSKRGQKMLAELEQALLALPEKKLIAGRLQDETGCVCTLGALGVAQQLDLTDYDARIEDCEIDMEDVGEELGMSRAMAWKLVSLNDEDLDTRYDREQRKCVPITPEERYEMVLRRIRKTMDI